MTGAQTPPCSPASCLRPCFPTPPARAPPLHSTGFDPRYAALAGLHRVQRVPSNEKRGRRHSSVIQVVALPLLEAHTAEAAYTRADVRIDTYRDSGPGGQHRNKTDSAVRLTHLPTGLQVTATEDRSQHVNRLVAYARLTALLAENAAAEAHASANAARREQVTRQERDFLWVSWRDIVTGPPPTNARTSYRRALQGHLDPLLKITN